MLGAVHELVKRGLYASPITSAAAYAGVMHDVTVDDRLSSLIGQVCTLWAVCACVGRYSVFAGVDVFMIQILVKEKLPLWRAAELRSLVSLPRLVELDWRVDLKVASEHMSQMAVPTAFVSMKLREQPRRVGQMPGERFATFELSKGLYELFLLCVLWHKSAN